MIQYLYFADSVHAERAAERLEALGYVTDLRLPEDRRRGFGRKRDQQPALVLGEALLVLDESEVARMRADLEALAQELGGEYDGWEAAVRPR